MGVYVNPGNENFSSYLRDEIYVDKTGMLSVLNRKIGTSGRFVCVSRPRRFGKTMTGNMIAAYYGRGCDSSELFENLKISSDSSYADHLNKYILLHLDIGGFWSRFRDEAVKVMVEKVMDDFKAEFKEIDFSKSQDVADCIESVSLGTGAKFVTVLDEYDVLMRDEKASASLLNDYLLFLNGIFKNNSTVRFIALAYLTGILPIIKEKAQSKLNNFKEYTILESGDLSPFVGFTDDEVRNLCSKYGMSYVECKAWYDGYRLGDYEIYDPRSVVDAMEKHKFGRYWTPTSSYQPILDCLVFDDSELKRNVEAMIFGDESPVNTMKYTNTIESLTTRDNILTYLCHLGYLAVSNGGRCCRIPNMEVRFEWVDAMEDSRKYDWIVKFIRNSEKLLESAWSGDGAAVAKAMDEAHRKITSSLSYNNEQSM